MASPDGQPSGEERCVECYCTATPCAAAAILAGAMQEPTLLQKLANKYLSNYQSFLLSQGKGKGGKGKGGKGQLFPAGAGGEQPQECKQS